MLVPSNDSGGGGRGAQNDRFMSPDSPFANFLIIIHGTKNLMRASPMGCTCTIGLELAKDPLPPGGILYTMIF